MKRSLAVTVAIITGAGLGLPQAPSTDGQYRSPALPSVVSSQTHGLPEGRAGVPRVPGNAMAAVAPVDQGPGPDPDILAVESALNQAMLDTLVHGGQVDLDLPDGTGLTLIVHSVDTHHGYQRIRVRSADEFCSGQFTRAPQGFFGTIATDRGVYAFENQGLKTYIVNHSELDRRNLPGLSDARRPHEA